MMKKKFFLIKNLLAKDNRGSFLKINYYNNKNYQNCFVINKKKFTLRGLHFQKKPFSEAKIITCIKGEIFDVIVNINKRSSDYLKWKSFLLSEKNNHSLFIGKDYAHGYLTLKENTIVNYQIFGKYLKNKQSGLAWNDKKINIKWPNKPLVLSKKDRNFLKL